MAKKPYDKMNEREQRAAKASRHGLAVRTDNAYARHKALRGCGCGCLAKEKPVSDPNQIMQFFHCAECLKELPKDKSPREFVALEVGWTKRGLQVWCVRHERNVISLDFKGQKVQVC